MIIFFVAILIIFYRVSGACQNGVNAHTRIFVICVRTCIDEPSSDRWFKSLLWLTHILKIYILSIYPGRIFHNHITLKEAVFIRDLQYAYRPGKS